jgi:hypothetical protein
MRTVTDLLDLNGWRWMHAPTVTVRRRQRDGSERTYAETTTKGTLGTGWPDIVAVRERVIYVELKADDGRLSEAQVGVREALRDAEAEWYCWRPRDWDEVVAVLGRAA